MVAWRNGTPAVRHREQLQDVVDTELMSLENKRHLLGISNTYMRDRAWLEHAEEDIKETLSSVQGVVVLPYALNDMDWYTDKLGEVFSRLGVSSVQSPHKHPGSERMVVRDAEAVYIGGGNTTRLLANLHGLTNADGSRVDTRPNASQHSLVKDIRTRVEEGMPLLGASAGLNVMCSDIRTTNDMHIATQTLEGGVIVSRIDSLCLLPSKLSINPHYIEKVVVTEEDRARAVEINEGLGKIIDHQGEPRETRLKEALEMDKTRTILALREGAYLLINGSNMELRGETGALIFNSGEEPQELEENCDLSYLLAD